MTRTADSGIILVARVLLSILYVWSGLGKLLGYSGFIGYLHSLNVPFTNVTGPLIVVIELVGGLVVIAGYRLRLLGVLFAIYTILTALVGHDFWNQADAAVRQGMEVNFWKNVGIAGGFLLLSVTGAGRFALDALRRSSSNNPLR